MLNLAHLPEYLTNLPLLQIPSSLLQAALNEGLRIARTQTGLIAFFDYEEGREAGDEIHLLRQFFASETARARAQMVRTTQPAPNDENPLTLWLPKTPMLRSMSTDLGLRRVLVLPIHNPSNGLANGFMLVLLPRNDREPLTGSLTMSAEQLAALTNFCRATGNAWYSLRSITNMARRFEDLVLLNEIATAITSNRDLTDLLSQIMSTTTQLLRSSACTLMLMDHNTDELVFKLPEGEKSEKLREFRQPAGMGISGYVARIREPVIVNDVTNDPRFNPSVDANTGFKTRNVMCAPMIVRDNLIGIIEVMNKLDMTPYNNNDLALLTTLAAQAAIAIENAQLYADVKDERDRLLAKEEEVRRDLARDLHDGPAQVVSGIAMRAGFIRKLMDHEPDKAREQIEELEKTALRCAKDVRTMLFGLRPVMLETKGLIPALEAYVEKLQTDPWQTHLEVQGFGDNPDSYRRLPPNTESAIFIIAQEAINNIRKHAEPKNVYITLDYSDEYTTVIVRDDGKGFDSRAITERYDERGSFGLLNMRERARLIGASFDLVSQPGQGTTIMLMIPHVIKPNQMMPGTGALSVSSSLLSAQFKTGPLNQTN
jgi:signal transduction histidine kinase